MRSDVIHRAKCGVMSAYNCRMHKNQCAGLRDGCPYIPKENGTIVETRKNRNKIHPIAIELTGLFADALMSRLPNTAWCIDLARTAIAWELIAKAENKHELFVQNKIREKIEKDKGVLIR